MEDTKKTLGAFVYNFERDSFQKTRIPAEQYEKAKAIVQRYQFRTTTAPVYAFLSSARAVIGAVDLAHAIDLEDKLNDGFELDPYLLIRAYEEAYYNNPEVTPEILFNIITGIPA